MEDYRNLPQEDIVDIVFNIRETIEDYPSYMKNYYDELVFMGHASTIDAKLNQAAIFGLRICLEYYTQEEDYLKAAKLNALLRSIISPKKSIVEASIIEDIQVCSN